MTSTLITNSEIKAFRACQRLHDLQYVQLRRPVVDADALSFGTVVHASLAAWWNAYATSRPDVALDAARVELFAASCDAGLDDVATLKAEVLMVGYDLRWRDTMDTYEVVAVEVPFEAPMRDQRGRVVRGFRIGGKVDALVRRRADGLLFVVEHKTSGADLSTGSAYWAGLRMDSQVSLYFDGARALGYEVAGCLYDVIVKPRHRPLAATPPDKREYRKGDGGLRKGQRETDETLDEFRMRLAGEIGNEPDSYYLRADVVRLDTELAAARADVAATARLMRESAKRGLAPRNPDACHRYGRPCAYFDACSGAASLDDETKFRPAAAKHEELLAA